MLRFIGKLYSLICVINYFYYKISEYYQVVEKAVVTYGTDGCADSVRNYLREAKILIRNEAGRLSLGSA